MNTELLVLRRVVADRQADLKVQSLLKVLRSAALKEALQ